MFVNNFKFVYGIWPQYLLHMEMFSPMTVRTNQPYLQRHVYFHGCLSLIPYAPKVNMEGHHISYRSDLIVQTKWLLSALLE